MDFSQISAQFHRLKAQYDAGDLSEADFRAQLEALMIQDEQGRWWMIGYETGQWYVHDGGRWVRSEPVGSLLNPGAGSSRPTKPGATSAESEMIAPRPANAMRRTWLALAGGAVGVILVVALLAEFVLPRQPTPTPPLSVALIPTGTIELPKPPELTPTVSATKVSEPTWTPTPAPTRTVEPTKPSEPTRIDTPTKVPEPTWTLTKAPTPTKTVEPTKLPTPIPTIPPTKTLEPTWTPILPIRFQSPTDPKLLNSGFSQRNFGPGYSGNQYEILQDGQKLRITSGPKTNQWVDGPTAVDTAPLVTYKVRGDFDARVKLTCNPTTWIQFAGFGVRDPADLKTWLRITMNSAEYFTPRQLWFSGFEKGTMPWENIWQDLPQALTLYLRITRESDRFWARWSNDGNTWIDLTPGPDGELFRLPRDAELYFVVYSDANASAFSAVFEDFIVR